jgi:hypothetical protein
MDVVKKRNRLNKAVWRKSFRDIEIVRHGYDQPRASLLLLLVYLSNDVGLAIRPPLFKVCNELVKSP